MEVERFQVVIIGTGPAGLSAAHRLAKAGISVAIVDEGPYGGTCPNRGCDPKKVLRAGAEIAHRSKALAKHGVTEPAEIDWQRLMAFKRSFTEPVPEQVESSLAKAGVSCYHGRASFIDELTVRVGDRSLATERVIIATGAKPRELRFEGAEHLATSDDVLEFDDLPDHALFVGGGYVSFELAHILNACGVACTIVHQDDHPLNAFEPAIVRTLIEATRASGVEIVLGADVVGVEPVEDGYHVHVRNGDEHHTYETDVAIHGAGREPNVASLDLHNAGIALGKRGISVDTYLRASEHVYAIGDCTSIGANLTPVAQLQGRIAANNIIGRTETFDGSIVPTVLFSLPEVASVGLSSEGAREAGIHVHISNHATNTWFSSRRIGEEHAASRVLTDRSTGLIVGAHLIGEGSSEIIHLFALAMREGITAERLASLVYAFPTHSSDVPSMF